MLLVIGITGHTGKYFLQELIKSEYKEKVRFFVREGSNVEEIIKSNLNYEIFYGDLNDKTSIEKACKDTDKILEIYNIKYSLSVLDSAISNNVKRIIFVHTTGIFSKYKSASQEYKKIEREVIEKAKNNNIDITILRPTMIYGDICDHNISKFIKMMDKMRIYPMIAGGSAKIQPVNARDLGKAYYQVLTNLEKTKNKNYNLSGKDEIKIKEMLKLILKKLNKKTLFVTIPMWLSVSLAYILKIMTIGKIDIIEKVLRMNEDRVFNNEEARKDFEYNPISFENGLNIEIEEYTTRAKRILFVATVDSHIMNFHLPYLKLFKEKGYVVDVATNGDTEIPYCDNHYKISIQRNPFKIGNILAIKELKKIIKKNQYQLIECHTPMGGVATRIAAKKSRKKGTKVIYMAHGFHFYKGAPILNWIIYYPIEKMCSRWTDCLITITNEDYKFAQKHMKAKRIEHINGIGMNPERLKNKLTQEEKDEFRKKLNINKNDIVFSYIAELNANKNQILLIKTIQELKKKKSNIKLLLIGAGKLKEEYQQYIKNNGLENEIKLLGKRQDINELLSITDIYLASSKREGLPVNVMEAMYKGLPIIATDNRGHRELIQDNENGYICKKSDVQNFKLSVEKISKDIKKINSMKEKNNTLVRKYELEEVKQKMEEIYKDMEEC